MSSFLRRKILDPLMAVLKQGITPEKMAWSLALGATIGLFPVLGVTALACAAVALPLRLNMVAIQAACWIVFPLELVLILPFIRLGEKIFRTTPLPLSGEQLMALFKSGFGQAISQAGGSLLVGMAAWLICAIPATLALYFLLLPLLRLWLRRMKR